MSSTRVEINPNMTMDELPNTSNPTVLKVFSLVKSIAEKFNTNDFTAEMGVCNANNIRIIFTSSELNVQGTKYYNAAQFFRSCPRVTIEAGSLPTQQMSYCMIDFDKSLIDRISEKLCKSTENESDYRSNFRF